MGIRMARDDDRLTVWLSGELDHHAARGWREQIDQEIERSRCRTLILDFQGMTFMDSSGIGLVMGRYRRMQAVGGTVRVIGASPRIETVMRLAGLEKLGLLQNKANEEVQKA